MCRQACQLLCSLLFLVISAAAAAGDVDYDEEDNVIVLTPDNFDSALQELSPIFVEFYAPWCGHCKRLAPAYSEAARLLKSENSPVKLAKIDGSEYKTIMEKYKSKGFPTLKLFTNGGKTSTEYPDTLDRSTSSIVRWLRKKTGSVAEKAETMRAIQKVIDREELVAVGFFKDEKKSKAARAFLSVAAENNDYEFLIVTKPSLMTEFDASVGSVVLFKQFDERRVDMTENITVESLKSFLGMHSHPLVQQMNQDSAMKIMKRPEKYELLLFIKKSSPDFNAHLETMRDVARMFRGKLSVVYMDTEADWTTVRRYGVSSGDDLPAVMMIDSHTQKPVKYRPLVGHQLTTGQIALFVNDVLAGKIKPFYRSAKLPKDWDAKPIKTLVRNNLKEVATDPTKDVAVKFYDPWNQLSLEFAPVWEQLAVKFERRPDVLLAELDITDNDLPTESWMPETQFKIPAVFLFPKGTEQGIRYEGEKTLENLEKFIESSGKTSNDSSHKKTEL